MTESTLSPSDTLSLGQQLKKARESLNLSIDEVALKTNLKKSHLESLENDIFILQNVAPAFVRGYVRSYIRFLRLPESLISSVNYGEVTIPKEIAKNVNSNVNPKSQGKWVKYLTVLVLLCAVSMTLLWWWQEYQKEQDNREQFVNNTVQTEVAPNSVNNAQPAPVVITQTPSSTEMTSVQPITSAQLEVATPAEVKPSQEESVPAAEQTAANTSTEAVAATAPVNVLQQAQPTENTPVEQQPVAMDNAELRIEVTNGQSWITVRGAKNKRLAEKLYTAGEVLSFNENDQYRLTIGAPASVKIYYKGQEVPLKIDGRVARIKLPLAQ